MTRLTKSFNTVYKLAPSEHKPTILIQKKHLPFTGLYYLPQWC